MSSEMKTGKKRGRPSIFGRPLTNAERIKRHRRRHAERLPFENESESDEMYEFLGEPYLQKRHLEST
jgi:hypothetical protein